MSYYYILHGVVYQAPDLMSVLSSRLQMASYYLEECLETGFYQRFLIFQMALFN